LTVTNCPSSIPSGSSIVSISCPSGPYNN
jgi:hypothetical protein